MANNGIGLIVPGGEIFRVPELSGSAAAPIAGLTAVQLELLGVSELLVSIILETWPDTGNPPPVTIIDEDWES